MPRKPKIPSISYNPPCDPKTMHGYRHVRWVENASLGLRLVGFADKIAPRSIDHTGWFTRDDDYDSDKYRGVVYQLPSRGETLYVYGYADPNNNDCALLCFDTETDKEDAARAADRFAELFAEEARDYDRAWQAGRRCEELAEEIKEARKEALTIAAEMRGAKRANVEVPTICATLRAKVLELYASIQRARKKRAELLSDFGHEPAFKDA